MTKTRLAMVLMGAALACPGAFAAQDKASMPKQPDPLTIAENNAKQILLVMDTDKNGMISKDEWMKFMSAEFDRLDVDHNGQLDQNELLKSQLAIRHSKPSDLGK